MSRTCSFAPAPDGIGYQCENVHAGTGVRCTRRSADANGFCGMCKADDGTESCPAGLLSTAQVPCRHLRVVERESVGEDCCFNTEIFVEVGHCAVHGRCELLGRLSARTCLTCPSFARPS